MQQKYILETDDYCQDTFFLLKDARVRVERGVDRAVRKRERDWPASVTLQ